MEEEVKVQPKDLTRSPPLAGFFLGATKYRQERARQRRADNGELSSAMAIADLLGRRIRADDADDSDEALEASSSSSPESLSADESESHEAVSDGSDMESVSGSRSSSRMCLT